LTAPDADDSFTVNHSAYGLFQSHCFQKAPEGTLICTTCHDPHSAPRGRKRTASIRAPAAAAIRLCIRARRRPAPAATCRADDAVHVAMTGHRIHRSPGAA
jgi:hypothetical protein